MRLSKFIFLTLISFNLSVSLSHAETIRFSGQIVDDYSCSESSVENSCSKLRETITQLKKEPVITSSIKKNTKDTATVKIENLNSDLHKILVVNYN